MFPQLIPTIVIAITVARIRSKAYVARVSPRVESVWCGWKREGPGPAKVPGIYLARPETVKRAGRNYIGPPPVPYITPIYINLFIDPAVRRSEVNTRRDTLTVQFLQYNI